MTIINDIMEVHKWHYFRNRKCGFCFSSS